MFHIASTGRPGPVLIDVPKDVQTDEVSLPFDSFDEYYASVEIALPGYRPTLEGSGRQIKKAAELIDRAERPVILAGHGVKNLGAVAIGTGIVELQQNSVPSLVEGLLRETQHVAGVTRTRQTMYCHQGGTGGILPNTIELHPGPITQADFRFAPARSLGGLSFPETGSDGLGMPTPQPSRRLERALTE